MDPVTLQKVIKSYLYVQYADDENLQAFVTVFNELAQNYVDTLNGLNLPIYTTDPVKGDLLDWVAEGLWNIVRPVLPTVGSPAVGAFDTYGFNELTINGGIPAGSTGDIFYTTDDVFRRVLTWTLFRGDGRVFNVRWIKRRIMRFLFGENGINFNVDQTYRISVTMAANHEVTIGIINNYRTVTNSAGFNEGGLNTIDLDGMDSTNIVLAPIPEVSILQLCFSAGVLETPFQFTFTVVEGGIFLT